MSIRLQNFRCYTDRTFTLGVDGLVLISGVSGSGKCMAYDTPIIMYNGSVNKIQDIKIGDILLGDDSSRRCVLSVTSGIDKMYEIIPKNGDSYTVNSCHILSLHRPNPIIFKGSRHPVMRYINNKGVCYEEYDEARYYNLCQNNVIDINIQDYLKLDTRDKKNLTTYHRCVEFDYKYVKSPYQYGYLLCSNNMLCMDMEYKCNSIRTRLKVLAGLVDSVGILLDKFRIRLRLDKVNLQVISDIKYLIYSLGFMIVSKKGLKYLDFEGLTSSIPCFQYKFTSINNVIDCTDQSFVIVDKGYDNYYGFEIDGNQRYLLGDFTVTHNTSILYGIQFAICGTGSKIIQHGRSSAKVTFEYKDLTIIRSKRPNRLVLCRGSECYEDASAQSILNEYFGYTFKTSGYLSLNNSKSSFILMSPSEKLKYIESFVLHSVDVDNIKKKICKVIQIRKNNLLDVTSKLEASKQMLSDMIAPSPVEFPIKCGSTHKHKMRVKTNEEIRLKNTITLQARNARRKNLLVNEKNLNTTYNIRMKDFTSHLMLLEKKVSDLISRLKSEELHLSEIECDEEKITRCRLELKFVRDNEAFSKILKMKEKVSFLETEYKTNIATKLGKLELDLKSSPPISNIKIYEKVLTYLNERNTLCDSIKDIVIRSEGYVQTKENYKKKCEKEITLNLEKIHHLKLDKQILKCPSCECRMKLIEAGEGGLELSIVNTNVRPEKGVNINKLLDRNSKLADSIKTVEDEIKQYKSELYMYNRVKSKLVTIDKEIGSLWVGEADMKQIPSRGIIETKLNELNDVYNYRMSLENSIKKLKLKQKTDPVHIKRMKNEIKTKMRQLGSRTPIGDKILLSEREYVDIIHRYDSSIKVIDSLQRDISNLNKEILDIKMKINDITDSYTNEYKQIRNISDIVNEIDRANSLETTLKSNKLLHESNIVQINKYMRYIHDKDIYTKWKLKVSKLTCLAKKYKSEYRDSLKFKEYIIKSENVSILNAIRSINNHAELYLNEFFVNDHIDVKLESVNSGKQNIPKLQVNIYYKGMDCDLTSLSCGELARVNIAYNLAISEMFNNPILLLDECTASLDEETTGMVIDTIRRNLSGKLVVSIAHQVIEGGFDNIIKV